MLERSKPGTSRGAITSQASTRPSASNRAISSASSGRRSSTLRKRRSAWSRSITVRNWSWPMSLLLIVEIYLDEFARCQPFAVPRHKCEAVGPCRGTQDRGAAGREGLDLPGADLDTDVIDTTHRRDKLVAQRQGA